jgi:hypothetical protein
LRPLDNDRGVAINGPIATASGCHSG